MTAEVGRAENIVMVILKLSKVPVPTTFLLKIPPKRAGADIRPYLSLGTKIV